MNVRIRPSKQNEKEEEEEEEEEGRGTVDKRLASAAG